MKPRGRVVSAAELDGVLGECRAGGRTIVLSNGTFDILHVGHVRCLEEAATLGDVLVVGVNADCSVRAYKGPSRPVVPEAERAETVAALWGVDWVVLFDEPSATELIRRVRPDVWAKGRDYTEASLPEAPLVRELGGRIALVGDPKDHASSDIIGRIRKER